MRLYISHGADRENPDWFIVEPRDDPADQIASLLDAGRTVYALDATAWKPASAGPGPGRLARRA